MFVRKLKKALVAAVAGCMVLGSAFTSLAAGENYKVKDLFVADTYVEEYADVEAAFGNDATALVNHYLTYGINENRNSSLDALIDLKKYREAYPDLEAAFGDNWDAYLNHYLTFGYSEGRNSFGTFDAEYYAERYPDLMAAFGNDVFQLYRHYLQFGINEGRSIFEVIYRSVPSSSSSVVVPETPEEETPDAPSTPDEPSAPEQPEGEGVVLTGSLTDPETGEPIANAVVEAIRVSDTGLNRTAGTVTGGDSTVTGGDSTVTDGDADVDDGYVGDGVYRVVADANGNYVFPSLLPGTYRIVVTAEGYIGLEIGNVEVTGEEETVVQAPVRLLSTSSEGPNGVYGTVVDATVQGAAGLEGVTIQFRAGWNATGSVVNSVTTDASGNYSIELPRGYYTATFIKDGYITAVENVISLSTEAELPQNASLSPSDLGEGEYRIVLTWGETPRDLDSHLYGQTETSEDQFHVYFGSRNHYEGGYAEENLVAWLDVDDTSSYGPETVTVVRDVAPGSVYRYSVHDYTNRNDEESYEMSNSGATVKVYKGATLLRTYNVPANVPGYIWNVFEIDGDGQISSFNTINSEYSSMMIPVEE